MFSTLYLKTETPDNSGEKMEQGTAKQILCFLLLHCGAKLVTFIRKEKEREKDMKAKRTIKHR